MSRILAIEWDRHEARGLILSTGPTGSSVEGAWAVSLATADMAGLTAKQIGTRLAAAMSGHLGGKLTTIVGAGRDNVQMKLLSLPPAPPDELPDMVRFQAEREFTALGAEAALDFIPLSGDAQTPHQVLAVAMSPAGMAEARDLCQSLGVEPDRIALRACGAGALAHRAGAVAANKVALVVNPLTDEADLTVQAGEHVHLMRTVRLPDAAQAEARQRAMVGEIRRTVAAARQQMVDAQVEQVVLCCSHAAADQANNLSDELGIPVTILDPVASAPAGLASQGVAADSLARFAAVLGVALVEADRRPPIVDFINFRRRREAQRFTRTHAIAAAAAAIAVLGIGGNLWVKSWRAAREIAAVRSEIQIAQESQKQYEKIVATADAVEKWLATDVNWLDELEQTAQRVRPKTFSEKEFPVNDDVVITQLTLFRPPGNDAVGGKMNVQAVAKNQSGGAALARRLRGEERHRVEGGGGQQDTSVPGYNWAFNLDVHVAPDDAVGEAKP
jgi:Tfp pilus assembly PilM family ATPase